MRLIATSATVELEAKKSRFIGEVHRVGSEEEARELIELTRKRYWNANHTCSAWRIGDGGALQRTNDDGEPGGSAGLPMLDVLRHRDLTNVVAVVTRYFGGTKLGVGGLIRAYGSAVSEAIARAGIVEVVTLDVAQVVVSHGDAGRFENALRSSPFRPEGVAYNAGDVAFEIVLQHSAVDACRAFVANETSGQGTFDIVGERRVEVPAERDQHATTNGGPS